MERYDLKTKFMQEVVVEGKRLGRHVEHDTRSLAFSVELLGWPIKQVEHIRHEPIFNQGSLGSCTGNAAVGMLACDPFFRPAWLNQLNEDQAIKIYTQATALDNVPGQYPPDDTGSSGLAVCKALRNNGFCKSYQHAFGLKAAVATLAVRPVIVGFGWYDSFDSPDADGLIKISQDAQIRGGHETVLVAVDPIRKLVKGNNSWGSGWGNQGSYWLSYGDLDRLLHEGGDVTTIAV